MNNELVKFIVYNLLLSGVTYLRVMYPTYFILIKWFNKLIFKVWSYLFLNEIIIMFLLRKAFFYLR